MVVFCPFSDVAVKVFGFTQEHGLKIIPTMLGSSRVISFVLPMVTEYFSCTFGDISVAAELLAQRDDRAMPPDFS